MKYNFKNTHKIKANRVKLGLAGIVLCQVP